MKSTILLFVYIAFSVSCNHRAAESGNNTSVAEADAVTNTVSLTPAQYKNAAIQLGTPVVTTIHQVLNATGTVDVPPQSLNSICFPLGGYLKSTNLLPGSSVQKGSAIAVMEDQLYVQLQQDYLTAKVKMEYLQQDLQRQKSLSDNDAVSKKAYQMAANEFKMQQIVLRSLEEKLKIIGINPATLTVNGISKTVQLRSPISGYVTKVNVNIGKYVNPTDVLFEIVDPTDIHAAITVFEKDIALIQKGMKGTVALADKPDKKYQVTTILVTKNISEGRTGLLHCHFENAGHDLLPGMFLTANMQVGSQKQIAVPEQAVLRYEGKHYVFVAKNQFTYQLQPIQVGQTENGLTAIAPITDTSWLKQQIVVANAYALLGKMKNKSDE